MSTPKAKWSILVYIAAHNNLDTWGERSLKQIVKVGSTADLKLAVLYDGTAYAKRLIVGAPGQPAVEEALPTFDSGDAAALIETVNWAFTQCPAERYGLVLWSHGTGWRPEEIEKVAGQARHDKGVSAKEATERSLGSASTALFRSTLKTILQKPTPAERAICFDDGTHHALDTLALEQVAQKTAEAIGQPLDLLGMDACLMATIEVAYQLRNHVRYWVASEELVPTESWPYDTILSALRTQPDLTAQQLAVRIVDDYLAYYTANPPHRGDVTKVAVDLSQIDDLARQLGALSDALQADMTNQADALWAAQTLCLTKETNQQRRLQNKFQVHLWDLATTVQQLALQNDPLNETRVVKVTNPPVKAAAEAIVSTLQPGGCIQREGHQGEWFAGLGGLSIYWILPKRIRISPAYGAVALAQESRWLAMLENYDAEIKGR